MNQRKEKQEQPGHQMKITMLGEFTLWQPGMVQPQTIELVGRAGRRGTLAAYLILHRELGVTAQELMELLWIDADNPNPASTLQNNISRLRGALAEMGFSDSKKLIRCEGGCYKWAPGWEIILDTDQFEALCNQFEQEQDQQKALRIARQAFLLYKGDFLPEAAEELWCLNLNAYYRAMYLKLCRKAAEMMIQSGRLQDTIKLCTKVIRLDPVAEEFSVLLMRALTASKAPQKALDHYEQMRELYQNTYASVPSAEMEAEKMAAIQQKYGNDVEENEIRGFLLSEERLENAYYCNNEIFREIINLQLRAMKRYDTSAQIMVVRLANLEMTSDENDAYMKQMEHSLKFTLRAGDPFTRIGSLQFWAMLSGAKPDSAEAVFGRVKDRMKRDYPDSKAEFTYKMLDLRKLCDLDLSTGRVDET